MSEKKIALTQKIIKGHMARQRHKISKLPKDLRLNYAPFLIGNDVPISKEQFKPHCIDKNFLVVGTSMFRAIDIGCSLAKSKAVFPKIIIIDNSQDVLFAWQQLKTFFSTSNLTDGDEFVNDPEDGLLEFVASQLHHTIQGTDVFHYYNKFFNEHDLEWVKKIVEATLIVPQDWGHEETFTKIKTTYSDRPIVAYASNIIHCVEPEVQIKALKNIETLQPVLSICTNLDSVKRRPTQAYVEIDCSAQHLADVLNLSDDVKYVCSHYTNS